MQEADVQSGLPNFFIIGGMRSGTTSLHAYLRDHPGVFVQRKEPRFFDGYYERGLDWYKDLFTGAGPTQTIGEGTPTYMYSDLALRRIREVVPNALLIAMLRDPVERAYSHYWMNRAREKETRTFEEAVDAEVKAGPSATTHYVDFGLHIKHLTRVCSIFDRSALHVELLEDMKNEPLLTYERVCAFLNVDSSYRPVNLGQPVNSFVTFRSVAGRRLAKSLPKRVRNVVGKLNVKKQSYPPMSDEARSFLNEYFAQPNRALAEWLGRPLTDVWSSAHPTSKESQT